MGGVSVPSPLTLEGALSGVPVVEGGWSLGGADPSADWSLGGPDLVPRGCCCFSRILSPGGAGIHLAHAFEGAVVGPMSSLPPQASIERQLSAYKHGPMGRLPPCPVFWIRPCSISSLNPSTSCFFDLI